MLAPGAQSEWALRSVPVGSGGPSGGRTEGPANGPGGYGTGKRGDVREMCAECASSGNFGTADKGRRVKGIRRRRGLFSDVVLRRAE